MSRFVLRRKLMLVIAAITLASLGLGEICDALIALGHGHGWTCASHAFGSYGGFIMAWHVWRASPTVTLHLTVKRVAT